MELPSELRSLHYLPTQFPHLTSSFLPNSPPYYHQINPTPLYTITPQDQYHQFPSSTYCNSTSDEADIIKERKQRRMISNRESARRSRMRKQKHLDELWSQVVCLRNENHMLIDKLNHLSESHDQALQENAQLKQQTTELRQILSDQMHLHHQ